MWLRYISDEDQIMFKFSNISTNPSNPKKLGGVVIMDLISLSKSFHPNATLGNFALLNNS